MKIMTKEILKSFADYWGEDMWVAYRKTNLEWNKWHRISQWTYDYLPNYRQILAPEMVWECDKTVLENEILAIDMCHLLMKKQVYFYMAFSGSKSYHIHTMFPELKAVPEEQRPKAKKLLTENIFGEELANEIDSSNFGNKHLILIEGASHPKTGNNKTIVIEYYPENNNALPLEIKEQIKRVCPNKAPMKDSFAPTKCPFVEYTCSNRLPISARNTNLVPNVVALPSDETVWQKCADAQGKNVSEFKNWSMRKPNFNCLQLQSYAKTVGLQKICQLCLLRGNYND